MNEIELKSRAQRLATRLNKLGFTKNGKPMVVDQAFELVAAEEGFRNQHVLRMKLGSLAGAVALTIPRVLDEEYAKAVLVQSAVDSDADWTYASEAWDLIVEEACKRAGATPCTPESEAIAERAWSDVSNRQAWNKDSEILLLEGFIRDNALMGELAKYAEQQAVLESDDAPGSTEPCSRTGSLFKFDEAKQAGYTVHGPDTPVTGTWAFCIDGDYTEGFASEAAAWDGACSDLLSPKSAPIIRATVPTETDQLGMLLAARDLEAKYGYEHPFYLREDWQVSVGLGDTKLGYWDWVQHTFESNEGADGHCSCGTPLAGEGCDGKCSSCADPVSGDDKGISIADAIYQGFDFGQTVGDASGWEWTSGQNVYRRSVFLENDDDQATTRITFTVTVTGNKGEGSISN